MSTDNFCCNLKCELNQIRDANANERREVEIATGIFGSRRKKSRRFQYVNIETKETMYFCDKAYSGIYFPYCTRLYDGSGLKPKPKHYVVDEA